MAKVPTRLIISSFFFFQAEDGIRDYKVTGVQTCALPICSIFAHVQQQKPADRFHAAQIDQISRPQWARPPARRNSVQRTRNCVLAPWTQEIGRASCRERV